MTITVHRGTHQIGGCCTEIRTDTTRIIIDLGDELPEPGKPSKPLELGRMFVCNGYIRSVLDLFRYDADIWTGQRSYPLAKVYGENLDRYMKKQGSCMIVRASDAHRQIMDRFPAEDSLLVYSMWSGYLDRQPELQQFVAGRQMVHLHASGHGSAAQIQQVCDLVRPRIGVIPIHTDAPEKLSEVCPGWPILHLNDGESMEI